MQALAEISHRSTLLQDVDVTSLVKLIASDDRVLVTDEGIASVVSGEGESSFEIRVAAQVANSATSFVPLQGSVSDDQVRQQLDNLCSSSRVSCLGTCLAVHCHNSTLLFVLLYACIGCITHNCEFTWSAKVMPLQHCRTHAGLHRCTPSCGSFWHVPCGSPRLWH